MKAHPSMTSQTITSGSVTTGFTNAESSPHGAGSSSARSAWERRFRSPSLTFPIADANVRVVTPQEVLLRGLTLDPTRNYQPWTLGWVSTTS